MIVAYKAFDRSGKAVSDTIEAGSVAEAGDLLRRQGLYVSEMSEANAAGHAGGADKPAKFELGGRGKRLRDMATFMRQLTLLIATGTPMVEAIGALERQLPPGKWKTCVHDIKRRIEEGDPFSVALEAHPDYFDPIARSLVAAGESGGQLDAMLTRLSSLTRQQLKVRASILGAMVYPCLLIFISLGVLGTMLFFVLPRFKDLFESLNSALPPTTAMLMDFSLAVRNYWWGAILAIIALVVGVKYWLGTSQGKQTLQKFMINAPQIGKVTRAFATARVLRVLGVLVDGRVPLLEALALTRKSSGNSLYEAVLAKAEDAVARGENISAVLEHTDLFTKATTEAIRSGERSGRLATVLLDLAQAYDEDNEIVLRSLSSIIEPLILIVLGALIGFVAVSMFLPLFDLATATQAAGRAGGG